jgi:P pilus assembly chaperone PapD
MFCLGWFEMRRLFKLIFGMGGHPGPNGSDVLEPATEVVASPPFVTRAPGTDYVVRVVRVSKQPVREEESYRVIVDQLPSAIGSQNRSVNVLIRQSIPVFFRLRDPRPASVSWTVRHEANKLVLTANNTGSQHLRIASLRLRNSAGTTISYGNGLAGYVLGQSFSAPSCRLVTSISVLTALSISPWSPMTGVGKGRKLMRVPFGRSATAVAPRTACLVLMATAIGH